MLVRDGARDVLIVGVGSMADTAVDVAGRLVAQGIGVTVVDPRWVKPVDPALVDLAREHRLVVSDRGQRRRRRLRLGAAADPQRPASTPRCGCTASRRSSSTTASAARSSSEVGLTAQTLARSIVEDVTALDQEAAPAQVDAD